jgi:hypothetical protein
VRKVRTASAGDSADSELLILAGKVREALVSRFGPAFRARTTEEIAADPQLMEAIGETQITSLTELLATADRWKFAPPPQNGQEEDLRELLSTWEAWHRSFLVQLPAKR